MSSVVAMSREEMIPSRLGRSCEFTHIVPASHSFWKDSVYGWLAKLNFKTVFLFDFFFFFGGGGGFFKICFPLRTALRCSGP